LVSCRTLDSPSWLKILTGTSLQNINYKVVGCVKERKIRRNLANLLFGFLLLFLDPNQFEDYFLKNFKKLENDEPYFFARIILDLIDKEYW
jgi:hypothetical protein